MTEKLTNLQRELLDVFAMDVSDEELRDIRRMLARYFANRATDELDAWAEEHDVDAETMARWADEHDRLSTSSRS